ncbi:MAG: ferritin-like domain-containing protein [Terriglobia bacterium]
MPAELCADSQQLTQSFRSAHQVCDQHNDVATASMVENWIGQTERRTWFLAEIDVASEPLKHPEISKHHQRQRAHKREKENLNAIHYGREGKLRQHRSLL